MGLVCKLGGWGRVSKMVRFGPDLMAHSCDRSTWGGGRSSSMHLVMYIITLPPKCWGLGRMPSCQAHLVTLIIYKLTSSQLEIVSLYIALNVVERSV